MTHSIKFSIHSMIVVCMFLFSSVLFADSYNGDWLDNGSGVTRIGDLKVTDSSITIKNLITYSVILDSEDGTVNIYKVKKANNKTDPLGCGPDGKANYIIIHSLPALAGTQQSAIRLIFYGRSTPPKMKDINNDPGVCAVYSFSNKTN